MSLVVWVWQLSLPSIKSEDAVDHRGTDWSILQDIKQHEFATVGTYKLAEAPTVGGQIQATCIIPT